MRLFGFLFRLVLLFALVFFLASDPGGARLVWRGYEVRTSAAFLALSLLGAAVALYALYRAWRLVVDGPRFWRLHQKIRRLERGQTLLTQGMTAIAGGDAAEAGRLAVAARKTLGLTAATRLLQAQAAQLAGDHAVAETLFRAMAEEEDGLVLGYRGMIMEAARRGAWDEVDRLAAALRAKRPHVPWLAVLGYEQAIRTQRWVEAETALRQAAAARLIEPPEAARREAVLLLALSETEARRKEDERALALAERAVKKAPDWLPALLVLAERQVGQGHFRTALRGIERAWQRAPHPLLIPLFLRAARASQPLDAYQRLEKLTRDVSNHPVSLLALGEAALSADLWGAARRFLTALATSGLATPKAYRLLAELERRERHDEKAAARWLAKAAEAKPDPAWICRSCGSAHAVWEARCPQCGAFDAFEWGVSGAARSSERSAGGAVSWLWR
jgi:HemY protein